MSTAVTLRSVSLGQCAVEIECRAPEIEEPLQLLLGDTRPGDGEVQARLILRTENDGGYAIIRDGEVRFVASTTGQLCSLLIGEIIFHLIENNARELLVHAACLRRGPLGILLPGASGAGKSTICAWLLSRGFTYLTDELVCINPRTFVVEALTRPLNIKHGGMDAVFEEFGENFARGESLESELSHLVPHRLLAEDFGGSTTNIDVVVFPKYASTAEFILEPLTPAKTALLLMQAFVNARNHPEHGFHDMTSFARTVIGYRLTYSKFEQLAELERELDAVSARRDAGSRTA